MTAAVSGARPQVAVQVARVREMFKQSPVAIAKGKVPQRRESLPETFERAGDTAAPGPSTRLGSALVRTPLPYSRVGKMLEQGQNYRGTLKAYAKSQQVEWNRPPIIEAKARAESVLRGK